MSTLRDRVIGEHISKYYPNSYVLNYNDENSDLSFYSAAELQSVDEDWFPLCCYKDSGDGHVIFGGRKNIFHTYTEGETGAGKTTRFVMQAILALSSLKVKPSFVIVDIHGEIIENLYNHLKENGYNIKILNCDNPQRSDTYNPFSELAKECLRTRTISNDAINRVRRIAEIIQPVESTTDPIWDRGARSYTNGSILDKFEDLINGDIPVECLTIYNVIQNHYWLRDELTRCGMTPDLFKIPHYRRKGTKAISAQKMLSVTNNADKTRASYFGVIENHYDSFGQPSLYSLSSNNTIDIPDFIDKPTVIVIQSGSTKIGDDLISLLMNDIYTCVVKLGKQSKYKKLPRSIHCFLDEFANCNIADGPEYIKMLTTSRKFGMYWHMILQCDAQLDRKYDPNIGRIIRANSTEIFMGSQDYSTEVRFAKSCGQKTIESLASEIAQQDPRLEVVDLITPDQLNLMEEGYIYIKSVRHPLTRAYFEAFYNCKEFIPVDDIDDVYPYNKFDYQQTSFYPDDIPPAVSSSEYKVLKYLMAGKKSILKLKAHFPLWDIKRILKSLRRKGAIEYVDDNTVKSNITRRQFDIYTYREENGLNSDTYYIGDDTFDFLDDDTDDDMMSAADFFDSDKPDDPFDMKPEPEAETKTEPAAKESEESDGLLSADEMENNLLFLRLRGHLDGADIDRMLTRIEHITMIPDFLMKILRYLALPEAEKKDVRLYIPYDPNYIEYLIIETFIRNNDFAAKEEWENKMREEYDRLVTENVFPKSIMSSFESALKKITNGLTIKEIREIKKIISDTE